MGLAHSSHDGVMSSPRERKLLAGQPLGQASECSVNTPEEGSCPKGEILGISGLLARASSPTYPCHR